MSKFKVGDLVYIRQKPFNYTLVYDVTKPIYKITNLQTTPEIHFSTVVNGNKFDENNKYNYWVDITDGINHEIKLYEEEYIVAVPKINNEDVKNFLIDGKKIKIIETDEGEWTWKEGKGYNPQYPNRYKYTLSDGSIIKNDIYTITNATSGGGGGKTRKNKRHKKPKKSRKLRKKNRRKTNRHH